MLSGRKISSRFLATCCLAAVFALPSCLMAESTHVVSPSDLQQSAVAASQLRQQNMEKVRAFLSTSTAEQAMKSAHMDATQVKNAVPSLSDQELAQLASRADRAQSQFAAGVLTNTDIALIVLGVAVIILIIVVAQ